MSPNPSRDTKDRAFILVKITAGAGLMLAVVLFFLAFPAGRVSADPLFVVRETLVASNVTTAGDAHLGSSTAVSGNTVVVGAPDDGDHGVAYVYVRPAAGWANIEAAETATLTLPAGAAGAELFGSSVSISGDTIVIGARGEDLGTGAAYVFVRPQSGWSSTTSYEARLSYDPDGAIAGNFGEAVDISGDTIVVGASGAGTSGKAFVFERPLNGWETVTATVELSNSASTETDYFGISVAVNAGTVVVGADYADVSGNIDQGAAFVFEQTGDTWSSAGTPTAVLTSTGNAGDLFGSSVDIREDGQAIVVGAENANEPGTGTGAEQGAAYIYMRPGDSWSTFSGGENAILSLGANGSNNDLFAESVAISNDTIVIGASGYGSDGGAVFVYVQPNPGLLESPATAWLNSDTPDATLSDTADGATGDLFGSAVATFGGTIVAGAPYDDRPGGPGVNEQGSAMVFENSYCSAQSGVWGDAATWVGAVPTTANDVCISTGHIVTVAGPGANSAQQVEQADIEVQRLLVNPGGTLDLNTATIAVSDTVQNNGTMIQQQFHTSASGLVRLLNILQPTQSGTVYYGADVDSASDLGGVTLTLRAAIDWFSPTSFYNYCTTDGPASPPYAKRCFDIVPEVTNQGATVTLWAQLDELNGIANQDLMVYRFASGNWQQLTPADVDVGFAGLGYINVSGPTPGFSFFLIGDQNSQPTAVDLMGFGARDAAALALPLVAVVSLLALLGAALLLWMRRRSSP